MKKLMTMIIAGAMTLALVGCGAKQAPEKDTTAADTTKDTNADEQVTEEEIDAPVIGEANALSVIETIWGTYEEEEKFPCGGGDSENMNFEGPAAFDITKTDELDATLGLPAELAGKIEDAASFMHMMNANTFTGACYALKTGTDVTDFAEKLEDNILSRQWICGIPETLLIVDVDGQYLMSAFGANDIIENLKSHITEQYADASVLVETAVNR